VHAVAVGEDYVRRAHLHDLPQVHEMMGTCGVDVKIRGMSAPTIDEWHIP
jgi:hypothetical protein